MKVLRRLRENEDGRIIYPDFDYVEDYMTPDEITLAIDERDLTSLFIRERKLVEKYKKFVNSLPKE